MRTPSFFPTVHFTINSEVDESQLINSNTVNSLITDLLIDILKLPCYIDQGLTKGMEIADISYSFLLLFYQ
jgi:hypothetical protein